jgi:steroid 5-alpha reductase family enzyme
VTLELVAWNAALVLALMSALWVVSVLRRDASVVDPWWSISFLLVTAHTAARTGLTPGKTLLLALVAAWALRLWLHLLVRSVGHGEDPRYAAFRQRFGPERYWWISFFQVFLLQGALALLISAPLQLASAAGSPDPFGHREADRRLDDIALVCADCYRGPLLTVEALAFRAGA